MLKKIFFLLLLIPFYQHVSAQCLDIGKLTYGGDWSGIDYSFHCPAYSFSYSEDAGDEWSILGNNIKITYIEDEILPIKTELENKILEYGGKDFFKHLTFYDVEVTYEDSIRCFDDRTPEVDLQQCNSKYYFRYIFSPIEHVKYHIGIALNTDEEIISPFKFPSEMKYKALDYSKSICDILNIAYTNNITPIKEFKFEYNDEDESFYWIIEQELINPQDGLNKQNILYIDASNTSIIKHKENEIIQHSYYRLDINKLLENQ